MKKNYIFSPLVIALIAVLFSIQTSGYSQVGVNGIELPPPDPACTNCDDCTTSETKIASTLGMSNQATDSAAFASGKEAYATGQFSTAIGHYVKATNNNGIVIGFGDYTNHNYLQNTLQNTIMFGVGSTTPYLTIRNEGSYHGIGIKTSEPASELDVNGTITAIGLKLANGTEDDVLKCDSTGNAVWTTPAWITSTATSGKIFSTRGVAVGASTGDEIFGTLQIGKEFAFYGAGISESKLITNNYKWVNTDDSKRINAGCASMIKLDDNSGKIILSAADSGNTINNIEWQSMTFTPEGKLGVGVDPVYTLDVQGDEQVDAYIHSNSESNSTVWASNSSHSYGLGVDAAGEGHLYGSIQKSNLMTFTTNGKILIGDTTSITGDHKLYVNGSILATEVNVALVTNWPDYVFEEDYDLPELNDVESFIINNGHLPGIPSKIEIEENGVNLAETDALLLKKIEELTLYVLEQQKMLKNQQNEIEQLKSRLPK